MSDGNGSRTTRNRDGKTTEPPSDSDPVIEVSNLSVTFDMERGMSKVLDSVDLDVYRGEILGVVGESGSGKSMLADSMLNAVVNPGETTGSVTYRTENGSSVDVLDLSTAQLKQVRWEKISMVFQGALSSFNPTMKIGPHFRETLSAHDVDEQTGMDRARTLLSDLYLEPDRILDSYPYELSGGMKQRALIALSLLLEPDVLVMDEPTAALDLLMQRSIITLLRDLQAKYDLTIVFITHDLELVAHLADRIAVLYAFEVVEVGPARNIILDSHHPYTRALINSTPNLETPIDQMRPIQGESPDPVNVPEGCSYHKRCPLTDNRCRIEDPELVQADETSAVACHYWKQVDEEVPLTIEDVAVSESPLTDELHTATDRSEGEQ